MRGSISSIVKPLSGQANLAEKVWRRFVLSDSSTTNKPSDRFKAFSTLAAMRVFASSLITIRSTTTSIVCLIFLSSDGISSNSKISPSTLTRW